MGIGGIDGAEAMVGALSPQLHCENTLSVNQVTRLTAFEEIGNVLDHAHAHGLARFPGGTAKMRQQYGIVAAQQGLGNMWLAIEHIQTGTADAIEPKCLRERMFIDDFAPRCVDEAGIGSHQLEPPSVYQVAVR